MSEKASNLRITTSERVDGARWRNYTTPDSIFFVTQVGRSLLKANGLYPALHSYKADFIAGRRRQTDTRRFLAAGGNARVFSLGDSPLAIKESRLPTEQRPTPDQLLPSLERMDSLLIAIEKNCPRWIDIPAHYGVLMSRQDVRRQFMLMQKINSGVTVKDIVNGPRDEEFLNPSSMESFGPITPDLVDEVTRRHKEMKFKLYDALKAEHLEPSKYLPDIDLRLDNVVVERLQNPIADSPIKLWVIDQ